HLLELTKHISKFRPKTYSKSILDNLKADESGEFVFMKQRFVGLASKIHNYDLEKYKSLPTQLGKKLIALNKKGNDINEILLFLNQTYQLSHNESNNIIKNLKYFQ